MSTPTEAELNAKRMQLRSTSGWPKPEVKKPAKQTKAQNADDNGA